MKYSVIISLVYVLCSCTVSEMETLQNDIEKNEITKFSYRVGGFDTFKCDPLQGQKILKTWSKTLKEALIASWPSPDNYLELSFKNGHKYSVKTFVGSNHLTYSVLYTDNVYTGEQLKIEAVCPGLKAHNNTLNRIGAKNAPPG